MTPVGPEDPAVQVRTTLPGNSPAGNINGVYVVLQGLTTDYLMGGYGYLQWTGSVFHEALDLNSMGPGNADLGAAVVTPLDGVVTFVEHWNGWETGFGHHVAVWVDDGRAAQPCYVHLAHLQTIAVREGQRVPAGTPLGTCGGSGNQLYAHCHAAWWRDLPPGADWSFWQTGYSKEWVAERTLEPEAWFWQSVAKAGGPPAPEAVQMLADWQVKGWLLAQLYEDAQIAFNPDSGTAQAWCDRYREGHYPGRPRSAERPYGEGDQAGVWVEFEQGALLYRLADGQASWTG
jgi:hypothetical protein